MQGWTFTGDLWRDCLVSRTRKSSRRLVMVAEGTREPGLTEMATEQIKWTSLVRGYRYSKRPFLFSVRMAEWGRVQQCHYKDSSIAIWPGREASSILLCTFLCSCLTWKRTVACMFLTDDDFGNEGSFDIIKYILCITTGMGFDIAIGKKCVKHVFIITTGLMSLLLLLPLLSSLLFYWVFFCFVFKAVLYKNKTK